MERYETDDITKALFFAARGGHLGIVEFIFEKCISLDDNFSLEWNKIFQQAIEEGLPNIFEVINPRCIWAQAGGCMMVVMSVCVLPVYLIVSTKIICCISHIYVANKVSLWCFQCFCHNIMPIAKNPSFKIKVLELFVDRHCFP
jgi:hypothetical protein